MWQTSDAAAALSHRCNFCFVAMMQIRALVDLTKQEFGLHGVQFTEVLVRYAAAKSI